MTHRRRFATYNYDQGSRLVQPTPATPSVATKEVHEDLNKRLLVEEQAKARLTELRGSDQSVLLFNAVEGPFNNPADTTPTQTILTFTVPQGRVLVVSGIGWKLSDPFLQGSVIYEVELYVDGGAVPFWQDATRAIVGGSGFGFAFGSMPFILDIEPIYVQSNSTLSAVLRRYDTAFVEYIAVAVIVRGWREKPVGGI